VIIGHVSAQANICPVQANTMCPTDTTCCASEYSGTQYGCCPYPNAVCCSNKQTCCEEGSECVTDGLYLSTCVQKTGNKTGISVCKPGPSTQAVNGLKNILIMGDSVSIGYTPYVVKLLDSKTFNVQHTPSGSDGGAEETAYGIQCLDYFLSTTTQHPWKADVITFNWGLHNYADDTVPGQSGPASVYDPQLDQIVQKLITYVKANNMKLIWISTTPVPFSTTYNDVVVDHNKYAANLMNTYTIPVVDLYSKVIEYCGSVPYWNCNISLNSHTDNNVHYTGSGYNYLAGFIVSALNSLV